MASSFLGTIDCDFKIQGISILHTFLQCHFIWRELIYLVFSVGYVCHLQIFAASSLDLPKPNILLLEISQKLQLQTSVLLLL